MFGGWAPVDCFLGVSASSALVRFGSMLAGKGFEQVLEDSIAL